MKNADMPAMPTYELNGQNVLEDTSYGLTKREHFAAMAMQGLLSANEVYGNYKEVKLAKEAVAFADALLKELSK